MAAAQQELVLDKEPLKIVEVIKIWQENTTLQKDDQKSDEMQKNLQENKYDKQIFINDLCDCYGTASDELDNNTLDKILKDKLEYSRTIRQQFYDIILHKFIKLDIIEINEDNFYKILKSTISQMISEMELKKANPNWEEIKKKVYSNKLNGNTFKPLKPAKWIKMFKSKGNITGITPVQWKKIYKKLNKWESRNYQKEKKEEEKEKEDAAKKQEEEEKQAIESTQSNISSPKIPEEKEEEQEETKEQPLKQQPDKPKQYKQIQSMIIKHIDDIETYRLTLDPLPKYINKCVCCT